MNKPEHSPLPPDAPDRIWVAPDLGDDWGILKTGDAIYWEGVDNHHPDDCETEYIRADIHQSAIAELVETLTASTSSICKCNICTRGRALIAKHKPKAGE